MGDRERLAQTVTRAPDARRTGRALRRFSARIERMFPRGAGTLAVFGLVLASVSYGVFKGGHADAVGAQLAEIRDAAANAVGFEIASIALTGEKQLTREEILNIAGISGRASLLFLDADAARPRSVSSTSSSAPWWVYACRTPCAASLSSWLPCSSASSPRPTSSGSRCRPR